MQDAPARELALEAFADVGTTAVARTLAAERGGADVDFIFNVIEYYRLSRDLAEPMCLLFFLTEGCIRLRFVRF